MKTNDQVPKTYLLSWLNSIWKIVPALLTFLLLSLAQTLTAYAGAAQSRNTSSVNAPIWNDINRRYTAEELFRKIMILAEMPLVTPKEIENSFGIQFESAVNDQNGVLIYNAKGDLPPVAGRSSRSFTFFYTENVRWTLNLVGFSVNKTTDDCIRFGEVLKYLIRNGWKEQKGWDPHVLEFYYLKQTEYLSSSVIIGNRLQIKETECLQSMQIKNGLKKPIPER